MAKYALVDSESGKIAKLFPSEEQALVFKQQEGLGSRFSIQEFTQAMRSGGKIPGAATPQGEQPDQMQILFDDMDGLMGDVVGNNLMPMPNDVDRDDVRNVEDCMPFDPARHGPIDWVKRQGGKLKGKFGELKEKAAKEKAAEQRGEEIERGVERKRTKKELEELQEEKEHVKKQKELAEIKSEVAEMKGKKSGTKGGGGDVFDTMTQIGDNIFSAVGEASGMGLSAKQRKKKGRKGPKKKTGGKRKYAVVDNSRGVIVETFRYKGDAKTYADNRRLWSVMKTQKALDEGYQMSGGSGTGGQDVDAFSEMNNMMNDILGG